MKNKTLKKTLHLCTFKTPPSGAVMGERGDADCALKMRNGVKQKTVKKKILRPRINKRKGGDGDDLPSTINYASSSKETILTHLFLNNMYKNGKETTKQTNIFYYSGSGVIQNLFMLSLMKKYNSKCIIKNRDFIEKTDSDSEDYSDVDRDKTYRMNRAPYLKIPLGISLKIENGLGIEDRKKEYENFIDQFKACYDSGINTIVIYVFITGLRNSYVVFEHANLLIYRRDQNTFEHFEPHGKYIFNKSEDIDAKSENTLQCEIQNLLEIYIRRL